MTTAAKVRRMQAGEVGGAPKGLWGGPGAGHAKTPFPLRG